MDPQQNAGVICIDPRTSTSFTRDKCDCTILPGKTEDEMTLNINPSALLGRKQSKPSRFRYEYLQQAFPFTVISLVQRDATTGATITFEKCSVTTLLACTCRVSYNCGSICVIS